MSLYKVSIVVPSYNHARYIEHALNSVVNQSYKDYEVMVLDDASTDESFHVIQEFIKQHPEQKISILKNDQNQGGVLTLNQLVTMASGEYLALINSDDIWLPDKLEKQVQVLDQFPEVGAVFTQALMVDELGQPLNKEIFQGNAVFMQKNRSRGLWLRHFFLEQNCLCHPSILIRRQMYQEVGSYDPRFRQIPDLQMWVRLLKKTVIHILEEPLVHLRWHQTNTSVISSANNFRGMNELIYIYREFFNDMPNDVFIEGFGDLFMDQDASDPEALECEKAFIYFKSSNAVLKSLYDNIGLDKIYRLLGDPRSARFLAERYQFSYPEFFKLGGIKFFDTTLYEGLVIPALSNSPATQSIAQPRIASRLLAWLKKTPILYRSARYIVHRLRSL